MKKICYVVTVPITIRAFFVPQLQYLAEHGFEVHVICSEDDGLQELLGEKIKYIPLNMPRGISFGGTIKAIKELTRIFKREKYDLVQYSTPNAAFNASIASKVAKIEIRNYHLMGLRYEGDHGLKRTILKMMEKISCGLSTDIECVSNSNMEIALKDKIFSREKATVVWNGSTGGVDLSRFDVTQRNKWRKEIRTAYGYREEDFVYGFVGRITRDKGIDELLEAFLEMKTDAKLFLIGKLENPKTLNQEILKRAKEHSSIRFCDSVIDIERYYAAIDVLVLPSYREGFGNVVIEAGALGTPAIVSDIPGPIDTIECGRTALVVPPKDVGTLKSLMQQIREKDYLDMGKNAAVFVKKKFDSDILCGKILERKKRLLGI